MAGAATLVELIPRLAAVVREAIPFERLHVLRLDRVKALTQARHNKTRAARPLGLTRAQLYSSIEKYGLAETES